MPDIHTTHDQFSQHLLMLGFHALHLIQLNSIIEEKKIHIRKKQNIQISPYFEPFNDWWWITKSHTWQCQLILFINMIERFWFKNKFNRFYNFLFSKNYI